MSKKRTKVWCDKDFAKYLRVKAANNGFSSPSKYTEWLMSEGNPETIMKDKKEKKKKKGGFYSDFF